MFSIEIKELWKIIEKRWHRPSSLVIGLLATIIILLWLFSSINISNISFIQIFTSIFVLILIAVIWFLSRRLPKTPTKKVGFGIAIISDTKEQYEKITKDFIATLEKLLHRSNLKFNLIEFPKHYGERINTYEDAQEIIRQSGCRFMLYGQARLRYINGQDHHVLDLDGIVAHSMVSKEIKEKFSKEFLELFPKRVFFPKENDLFNFEFTSEWVNFVSKYIIGIASLISGDIRYAQLLFEDLFQEIEQYKKNFPDRSSIPSIVKIHQRLPLRLTEVYFAQINTLYNEFKQTKSMERFDELKICLEKIFNFSPNKYEAHLTQSIFYFLIGRDIQKAIAEIRKCKDSKDATWRYNLAFLYAYKGDLKRAIRLYKTAFKIEVSEPLPVEIEDFICWVLEQEPEKVQLHFCLALINYYIKDDKARAFQEFEKFKENADRVLYANEIMEAENFLIKIQKELAIH